ncbi:MAG: flagellin [Synergistaceae bacterium]|nr:flagellin [Synergistaceae bacterium]
MRIYHNIPALTAYNSLNSTNNAMESTIKKLSTGLRINSAADDAAGFAISEKMRSQISGLEIAIRNTQDATSMLQVAEGALGETNSMLQRMRELAVQASNDTLTSQDRSYIQLEINQLADQIDRIAKTTQFNKKRLLDGSSAGITSSSNLNVKAYVNGSLREIDQFGQKKSFEGNFRIKVTVDPSQTGTGQVQKSSVMTIKHPNVISDVSMLSEKGVTNVEVDNLPAANYKVTAEAPTGGAATVTGAYGFKDASTGTQKFAADVTTYFNIVPSTPENNASILFTVSNMTGNESDGTVVLSAQSNILKADGTVDSAVMDDITLKINSSGAGTIDISKLIGSTTDTASGATPQLTIQLAGGAFEDFSTGSKFVLNVSGAGTSSTTPDMGVQIVGDQDLDWPDAWYNETTETAETDPTYQYSDPNGEMDKYGDNLDKPLVSQPVIYNINSDSCQNKQLHFRNFYLNAENGTVYNGDVILTTSSAFSTTSSTDAIVPGTDELASFTAAYIGKTAVGDTKLRDLNTFWNSSGVFMLDTPKTITLTQGDGTSTNVTVYATDTLNELKAKFNDAIANGLGQARYLTEGTDANKFCTFVEKTQGVNMPSQGLETVAGTFIFRSLLPGSAGDITFSGDEDLINSLAFNVVQESSTTAFVASIYDAHTGIPVNGATNVKVSENRLIGVLHPNVDIEFSATANIKATWSDSEDNFLLTADTDAYDAVIHIVDSSTVFQIGANEGEDIAIDIGNMSAGALGVTNINVSTRTSASKSIGQIDAAINKVSTQRAKIGAYQNALEYTSDNLTTTMTNLTAAESRIRDADMAQTMMEFVKLQILNQSGTSMLAQANQLPQSVMSLLQG